jgi:hypothetical protein
LVHRAQTIALLITKRVTDKTKSTQVEASKFIRAQKDWLEDKTGFAILTSQNLDKDVEDFLD